MTSIRRNISYLPAFLSVSLVMFVIAMLCLFMMEANSLKKAIKEDVRLSIYFRDEANDSLLDGIKKELLKKKFVQSVHYISKEEGLKLITSSVGENPDSLLGFNPIPKTLEVRFKEGFVNESNLEVLQKSFESTKNIREVNYDKNLVQHIDRNIRRVGFVMLGIALIMSLISIMLINNTIRLSMYSKRFIIKSMQFVGATKWFIVRPFLYTSISIGVSGGIFACLLLFGALKLLGMYFPIQNVLHNYLQLAEISVIVVLISIIICLVSSYFSIKKYLRLKIDDLF